MEFSFKKKTVIFTIGPSNCGKSSFASALLEKIVKIDDGIKALLLSSDQERRKLLNDMSIHKHDRLMNLVSKQAFDILLNKLDVYTQYPVNFDFVIVDATHMSEISRRGVVDTAKKNGYNIVPIIFDYFDKSDYFELFKDEKIDVTVIENTVKKHRENLKELNLKGFDNSYKIRKLLDLNKITVKINDDDDGRSLISNVDDVLIIGDIHGCIDTLKDLIIKSKMFTINNDDLIINSKEHAEAKIILVGDYLDKNNEEKLTKTIEFIYKNQEKFLIVIGNHEKHCYDVIKGKIKRFKKDKMPILDENGAVVLDHNLKEIYENVIIPIEEEEALINLYFTSILLFDKNEEVKNKFLDLYEKSFYYIKDYKERFIVTHAPCKNSFLGKNNEVGYKNQSTVRYPKMTDNINESLNEREEFFKYLKEEANHCLPYHIFGHVSVSEIFQYVNKINLDTGCYTSGNLSGVIFSTKNKRPFFVKSNIGEGDLSKVLYPMFRIETIGSDISNYDKETKFFLRKSAGNKVAFISGTMSPTDKDLDNNELESLRKGIEYYKNLGVKKVILQPKKMGSRCNLYLYKNDSEKSYLVSRNGYVINERTLNISKSELLLFKEQLLKKFNYLFDVLECNFIILDGELLPWKKMANGLIERDFNLPFILKNNENEFLGNTGFFKMLNDLKSKEGLNEYHLKSQKRAIDSSEILSDYETVKLELEKYNNQVQYFARDYEIDFSPFMILKIITNKNEEINCLNHERFTNERVYCNFLRSETYALVDTETLETFAIYKNKIVDVNMDEFYDLLSYTDLEEGVVIKPSEAPYQIGVAPYLKCRNKEYLRMTYGYNYLRSGKYKDLLRSKSIKNKLKTSIKEWEIIRELLDIPYNKIDQKNNKYIALIANLHKVVTSEKELDPRL